MRAFSVTAILLVTIVLVFQTQGAYSLTSYIPTSSVGLSGARDVPLNIRVIFIGINQSDINSTYLTSAIVSPSEKPESILAGSQGTGVLFKFNYQVNFANSTVTSNLSAFLNGIGKRVDTSPGGSSQNVRNLYFENSTTNISTVTNWFYDANQLGNWSGWSQYFGPGPIPGYTLFLADVHNYLPSLTYSEYQEYITKCQLSPLGQCQNPTRGTAIVHYYNRTITEPDLGRVERRPYMTGWGIGQRSYFIDLSAGPSFLTQELPIQVAAQDRGVDLNSWYGKYWKTKYSADYLAGVIYNLFSPDQLYPVNYSARYNFHLFFFDARNSTEIARGPSLTKSVNLTRVSDELAKLVPYANVTLVPKFANITSNPDLAAVVTNATTTVHGLSKNDTIVDERLVYNWLSTNSEGHISRFINVSRTIDQIDIPAFIFAFTGNYNFGVSSKGNVFLQPDLGSIYGEALGDLVLISHGQHDLTLGNYTDYTGLRQPGKGVGFTRTIIHELGHMLGLNHPFLYDEDEDFVDSVMGYWPNSLAFSQFDKDLILRGVNDELLIFAQVTLANTTSSFLNAGAISSARRSMTSADRKYSSMDYAGAVSDSLAAAQSAFQAHQVGLGFLSSGIIFGIIGLVAGIAIGLLAGFLAFRKRPQTAVQYYRCPTCGQTLRWDPAIMRWYCDQCQRPV